MISNTDLDEIIPLNKNFKMLVSEERHNHYLNNGFENFTAELMLNHLQDITLFIDIGAHYGYYSLLVGSQYPNCRIIAFEPVPINYEILQKNIELNHLKNVETYNLAVSNEDGIKKLFVADHPSRSGFYESHLSNTIDIIDIKTIAIDNMLKEVPATPTIIKIDAEGHEIPILEGMKSILRSPVRIELFIEFNPEMQKKSGHEPEDLLKIIDQMGFNIFFIDDESRVTYKIKNFNDWSNFFNNGNNKKDFFNLLCLKKERSLSICVFSHSPQLAGAERSLLELTTELIKNHGVLCTVILPNDGPLRERLVKIGSSVILVNYRWWCDAGLQSPDAIQAYYGESIHELNENMVKIAKINPDVILTNTMVIPWGAICALSLDKPHVWYVREFGQLDHGLKFYLPFGDVIEIIKTSNRVIANSEAVNKTLFKEYSNNVATIYNHINIQQVDPSNGNIEYFSGKEATRLIIVGYISKHKGQMDAVLAVKALVSQGKSVELIILGEADPKYREELEEIVRTNGLETNVKIIDFQKNPYAIIEQADIVLVCSKNEAFGRTIVESWLLKKPVIATDSGGIPELVKDDFNGLLYQSGDYAQLAQKIRYLIENKNRITELGSNGYDLARTRFTEEKYGGEVYRNILEVKNDSSRSATPLSRFALNIIGQELQVKEREIKQKDEAISRTTSDLQSKETEIRQKDEAIKSLKGELNLIKDSRTWRSVVKFQSVLDRLMPHGTKRRKTYDNIFMGLRKI